MGQYAASLAGGWRARSPSTDVTWDRRVDLADDDRPSRDPAKEEAALGGKPGFLLRLVGYRTDWPY